MEPSLSLDSVSLTFSGDTGSCPVLKGVTLDAYPGEIVCVMGPSGCGKTTLLRVVAGLERADQGTIRVAEDHATGERHAAMVFQDPALFPWLSVRDNIVYGLRLRSGKVPEEELKKRALALLSLVRLESFAGTYPYELSGGMRQRAAVARALAVQPRVLLMDEPFSALDVFTRRELEDEILRIRDAAGREGNTLTILLITHNPEEAVYLADRILILSDRPAFVYREIRVDLPHPRNPADPGFLALREQVTGLVKR
jgi:ABC-type nitrate/sulfonate/bicarbonate transport system ATPase subunit